MIFEKGIVDYLAEKSGGMLRDFVRLLGYTIELGQARGGKLPISQDLAERAFNTLINEYGRSVPDGLYFMMLPRSLLKTRRFLSERACREPEEGSPAGIGSEWGRWSMEKGHPGLWL